MQYIANILNGPYKYMILYDNALLEFNEKRNGNTSKEIKREW